MILAWGSCVRRPSSSRALFSCFSFGSFSENADIILEAKERSDVSTTTPAALVNALTIGKREYVAKAGASSVLV